MGLIYYKKKNAFSSTVYVKNENVELAVLKMTFSGSDGSWEGSKSISFLAIGGASNSYRITIAGKSIGYIHINFFRNGATVNFVKNGSYQYDLENIVKQKWGLRNDKLHIESLNGEIYISQSTFDKEEIGIACSIFITFRISKDLRIIISGLIIGMMLLLMI